MELRTQRPRQLIACIIAFMPLFFGTHTARAQGLGGLGPPGGLVQANAETKAIEMALLGSINALRNTQGTPPLKLDERVRLFSRAEARISALEPERANTLNVRIRERGIAPYGYYIQYAFGRSATALFAHLKNDAGMRTAMVEDFAKVGIGVFHVPDNPPYWQAMIILLRVKDPMAGKPGLTQSQTDEVMHSANSAIQQCYNQALALDPNAAGMVIFNIVIGTDGRIAELSMLKSFPITIFNTCALNVVSKLRFPRPYGDKPVTLRHPIQLTPNNGGRRVGRLSKLQIRNTFSRARRKVQRCYDSVLSDFPKAKGSVVVAFIVVPTGQVQDLEVQRDDLRNPELTACVRTQVGALRFPVPDFGGEVDIVYPFVFAPPNKQR